MTQEEIINELQKVIEQSVTEEFFRSEDGTDYFIDVISPSIAANKVYQFLIDNNLIK